MSLPDYRRGYFEKGRPATESEMKAGITDRGNGPACLKGSEHGLLCGLRADHYGDHVAFIARNRRAMTGTVIERWTDIDHFEESIVVNKRKYRLSHVLPKGALIIATYLGSNGSRLVIERHPSGGEPQHPEGHHTRAIRVRE